MDAFAYAVLGSFHQSKFLPLCWCGFQTSCDLNVQSFQTQPSKSFDFVFSCQNIKSTSWVQGWCHGGKSNDVRTVSQTCAEMHLRGAYWQLKYAAVVLSMMCERTMSSLDLSRRPCLHDMISPTWNKKIKHMTKPSQSTNTWFSKSASLKRWNAIQRDGMGRNRTEVGKFTEAASQPIRAPGVVNACVSLSDMCEIVNELKVHRSLASPWGLWFVFCVFSFFRFLTVRGFVASGFPTPSFGLYCCDKASCCHN